jgi:hypothetical protein
MGRHFEEDLERDLRDPDFASHYGAAHAKSGFAITLVKARMKAGLTQGELAKKAGVSRHTSPSWRGAKPTPPWGESALCWRHSAWG